MVKQSIILREFEPKRLPNGKLSEEEAEFLYRRYGHQVSIEFPSPKTDWHYELRSLGWVGYIPLSQETDLILAPKVPLQNLFGMWEYAYRLNFEFLKGLKDCESLKEYYDRLAAILARKIIDRTRRGLYRAYLEESDDLPYVRGRIDVRSSLSRFGALTLPCRFEEHQVDVQENQILLWTLTKILFSGFCTEHSMPILHKAFRGLRGAVRQDPCTAASCDAILYNRLNLDYQPLHALCRFFLEQSGPTHVQGDRRMLPFLVNMAKLFELFVAEWLSQNIDPRYEVKAQYTAIPENTDRYKFQIDIVLYDRLSGEPYCVIDTKYKNHSEPEHSDVAQVVTYAELMGCKRAFLVYPVALERRMCLRIGGIQVECACFPLEGDLQSAGEHLIKTLLS
jgi:5-methylcytosine-specific restriction enzyme subunit McrC